MAFKKIGTLLTGATFALALSLSAMAQTQSTTTTTSQDNTMAPQSQSTHHDDLAGSAADDADHPYHHQDQASPSEDDHGFNDHHGHAAAAAVELDHHHNHAGAAVEFDYDHYDDQPSAAIAFGSAQPVAILRQAWALRCLRLFSVNRPSYSARFTISTWTHSLLQAGSFARA